MSPTSLSPFQFVLSFWLGKRDKFNRYRPLYFHDGVNVSYSSAIACMKYNLKQNNVFPQFTKLKFHKVDVPKYWSIRKWSVDRAKLERAKKAEWFVKVKT